VGGGLEKETKLEDLAVLKAHPPQTENDLNAYLRFINRFWNV